MAPSPRLPQVPAAPSPQWLQLGGATQSNFVYRPTVTYTGNTSQAIYANANALLAK